MSASSHWPLSELADAVRRVRSAGEDLPTLVRVTLPAPRIDPLEWLASQPRGQRGFWSGRSADFAVAYVGAADSYSGSENLDFKAIDQYLSHMLQDADPSIRYYGGMRFDARRPADHLWEGFGSLRFVLPRFEYVVRGDQAELACNIVLPRDGDRLETVARACRGLAVPRGGFRAQSVKLDTREDEPTRATWIKQIDEGLGLIDQHAIQKVVLARRSSFSFDGSLPAPSVLHRLRKAAPNRFHFLFEAGGHAFVGATPERLFCREGRDLLSEAVAGTRPRSANEADDEVLRSALLESEKDQREHLSVRWAIEEILRPFCKDLTVDAHASEMRLAKGRHLVSRFQGRLRRDVSTWDLLRHLHPTPAVGGYPAQAALQTIRQAEGFDRGWYAGPVGWVGSDAAEFAVALRCGLVERNRLHLFSGAGIVQGSQPHAEWDEIEHKIVDFANVIGLSSVEHA